MNAVAKLLVRIRKCPLASTLVLSSVMFYGITFFFALEQTTVMVSALAIPEITALIGLPTLTAILAIILGSKCGLDRDGQM